MLNTAISHSITNIISEDAMWRNNHTIILPPNPEKWGHYTGEDK